MDPSRGPVLQDKITMGLRLSDSTQTSIVKQSLSPDFGISTGRTKVMALNASGRNFIVSSNGKVDASDGTDDVDETSSGYSSRESQCGENRAARMKSQKVPPKIVYLSKEVEKPPAFKNESSKDSSSLQLAHQNERETIANKGELSAVTERGIQSKDNVFSLSEGKENLDDVNETEFDRRLKICSHSCSTCSCKEELLAFADRQKFHRQPRVDVSDDTPDHLPPDKLGGNEQFLVLDSRIKAKDSEKTGKEYREVATQHEFADHELFQECSSLKVLNTELEGKLKSCNDVFELAIKRMEKQLENAVSEITQLKSQLSSMEVEAMTSSPCIRCGYWSDGEVTGSQRSSSRLLRDSINNSIVRRAGSTDGINIKQTINAMNTMNTNPISQQPKLMRTILKGGNPDKIKTSLLERNKSLKNEIQTLKDKERICTNPTRMIADQEFTDSTSSQDFVVNNGAELQSNIPCKPNAKEASEDVRWKQPPIRVARRPRRSTTRHPQFTSPAFRTIHVANWGPQV